MEGAVVDAVDTPTFKSWPWIVLLGVVNIGIGLAAILWPEKTATILAWLFGLQILVLGILRLVSAIRVSESDVRGLLVVFGALGVAVGLVVIRNPFEALTTLFLIVGVFWLVWGLVEILGAVFGSGTDRAAQAIGGVVYLVLGIFLVAATDLSVTVTAVVVGAFLVVTGIVLLWGGFSVRKMEAA
jgi:uncharacterized membrane protein HdeD (DUF308 family)